MRLRTATATTPHSHSPHQLAGAAVRPPQNVSNSYTKCVACPARPTHTYTCDAYSSLVIGESNPHYGQTQCCVWCARPLVLLAGGAGRHARSGDASQPLSPRPCAPACAAPAELGALGIQCTLPLRSCKKYTAVDGGSAKRGVGVCNRAGAQLAAARAAPPRPRASRRP